MKNKFATLIIAAGLALTAVPTFATNAAPTLPVCNDGTTATKVGKGACAGHKGVKVDPAKLSGVSTVPTPKSAAGVPTVGTK